MSPLGSFHNPEKAIMVIDQCGARGYATLFESY